MTYATLTVKTADGVAEAHLHKPAGTGPWPGVLLYVDAFGLRPTMDEMAERLASNGFAVLVPDLFYRAGKFPPFDPRTAFGDEKERARIMALIQGLDTPSAMRDTAAYLDALGAQEGVKKGPFGAVGYCMGGRLAFTAAGALPERIGAAASIHGGHIATDAPESPHRQASKIKARLYFGIADNDRGCTPEQQAQLKAALNAAHVRFDAELYPGALHGFAVPDHGVYNKDAAEKQWQRVIALFREAL